MFINIYVYDSSKDWQERFEMPGLRLFIAWNFILKLTLVYLLASAIF